MADEKLSEREKSLYLKQIKFLDEELERYQLKCDEMEKKNQNLVHKCKALEEDQKNRKFLDRLMAMQKEEVEELTLKLETQRQEADQSLKELELQQNLELEVLQEQVDKLTSQLREGDARSEEIHQLEEQVSGLEALKEQLRSEEKQHQTIVEGMKRDMEMEKNRRIQRMEEEQARAVSETIWELMAQAVKPKQQEQEVLKKIETQQNEIENMRENLSMLYTDIEKLEEHAAVMEKKLSTSMKETEKLTKMNHKQQMKKEQSVRLIESKQAEIDQLRQQIESEKEKLSQKTKKAAEMKVELQEGKTRLALLEGDVKKAIRLLRRVVQDQAGDLQKMQSQTLIKILERNLPDTEATTLAEFIRWKSGAKEPENESDAEREERLKFITDPEFLLTRLLPGDFGIIPRRTWKL